MEKTHQWGFPLIAANPTIQLHPGSNLSPNSPRMCGIQMAAGSGTHPQADGLWWRTDPVELGWLGSDKAGWFKKMNGWLNIDPDISRCGYMSYVNLWPAGEVLIRHWILDYPCLLDICRQKTQVEVLRKSANVEESSPIQSNGRVWNWWYPQNSQNNILFIV